LNSRHRLTSFNDKQQAQIYNDCERPLIGLGLTLT